MKLDKTIFDKIISLFEFSNKNVSNRKILIALSGGVDSVVLSHLLFKISKDINFKIGLAHVNYNMHSNSTIAMESCKKLAKEFNCKIFVKNNFTKVKSNIEARARDIRYNYLQNLASEHNFDYIVTAHHKDDQIETLFMKDIQNSDWISKIGIREYYGKIYRPLLNISKKTLIQYAIQNNLKWVEDTSNIDEKLLRNKVRHSLLPTEIVKNPQIKSKLFSQAQSSIVELDKLNLKIKNNINKLVNQVGEQSDWFSVYIGGMKLFTQIEKKYFCQTQLNKYFNMTNIQKSSSSWHEFDNFIKNASIGSKFVISNNVSVLKDRVNLIFYKTPMFKSEPIMINNIDNYYWNDSQFKVSKIARKKKSSDVLHVPLGKVKKGLIVRNWKESDKINSFRNKKMVKVSKLLTNEKVSLFHKNKYPIITDNNDNILWIPGIDHSVNSSSKEYNVEIKCKLFIN